MTVEALVRALAWTLVHFVWQGTALWLALALVRAGTRRASARLRYASACATLAAMALAPAVTAARLLRDAPVATAAAAPLVDRAAATASPARAVDESAGAVARDGVARATPLAGRVRDALARWAPRAGAAVTTNATLILVAWAAGVLALSVRLAGGCWLAARVARAARVPAPPGWDARLAALRRRLGVAAPVRLAASSLVRVPGVIGWLEPVILVPVSAFTGLAPGQLELLLAHELAHVRRHDYLVNVAQSAVETLLFFHPAVWRVSAWVREEREHCCDDVAAAAAASPIAYVRALADMEALRAAAPALPAAPALALHADGGEGGGPLLRRVARLAERAGGRPDARGAARPWPGTLLVGAMPLAALAALAAVLWAGARAHAAVWPPARHAALALGLTPGAAVDSAAAALLARGGRPGLVVVQDVRSGAVVSLSAWAPPGAGPAPDAGASAVPASVWKLTLAAMWWDAGLGDEEATCAPHLRVGAQRFDGQVGATARRIEVPREMLALSCTTAAARMALRLRDLIGPDGVRAAYARLGFAPDPAEVGPARDTTFWATVTGAHGAAPDPERPAVAAPDGDDGTWAALAVGSAGVRVSPLHVSRLLQAIGNDGVALPATPPGVPAVAGRSHGTRAMAPATARRLREAMLDVVRAGTASAAAPRLTGTRWSLGGKTGTARAPGRPRDDGWFAGLVFDASGAPRYTVVVRVDGGGPGGGAPALLAAELTRVLAGEG